MKRLALLTVFFYVCTFAAPQRAQAVVPAVAIIGAAAIGTAMATSSALTYYAKAGSNPQYVSTSSNASPSAADMMFQPAYAAIGPIALVTAASFPAAASVYLGKNAAIGAKVGDICNHAANAAVNKYDSLKQLVKDYTTPDTWSNTVPAGAVSVFSNGKKYKLTSANYSTGMDPQWCRDQLASNPHITFPTGGLWITGVQGIAFDGTYYNGGWMYRVWFYNIVETNDPADYNPTPGAINYSGISGSLKAPSDAVAKDVKNVIRDLPPAQVTKAADVPSTTGAASAAPTVTNAEVNQAVKQNTAEVAQKAADNAAEISAANPTDVSGKIAADQAAVEAAKAQEEAAAEELPEETFSPITDTAFVEPYNPGEFDIPARFTTFLNNVQSSGLFSFSNDFFNSLPGGGSPIFEIEGGMFGSHRIDLSETMNGGLAVLKTVLLALFGFLSIRAVIMKR